MSTLAYILLGALLFLLALLIAVKALIHFILKADTEAKAAADRQLEREIKVEALRIAILPILSAYRNTGAGRITKEQITAAWAAYDALREDDEDG